MSTAAVEWELWSTRARLVVTNPAVLPTARELVDSYLAKVDDAANRFRDDTGGDIAVAAYASDSDVAALNAAIACMDKLSPD